MWQAQERTTDALLQTFHQRERRLRSNYERINQAAAKEKQNLAELARECTLGIVEIIIDDPLFSIAPCEACGHVNGKLLLQEPR